MPPFKMRADSKPDIVWAICSRQITPHQAHVGALLADYAALISSRYCQAAGASGGPR
ncbi:hypothetical protein [Candidatus Villigracilis affinis]|uniref:hypothetical protein n=1 Tax=Candidatus Villigracilis affinis TaxID=3140682 RepID=UPI002A1A222E|nr:hypothetical protein [Anaerolineales bacterium]